MRSLKPDQTNRANSAMQKTSSRILELAILLPLASLTIILPNAFKEFTAVLLLASSCYYIFSRKRIMSARLFSLWLCIAIVTLVYVLIGILNGAPNAAAFQAIVIYIISPLLWIISARGALESFGIEKILRLLLVLTVAAFLSQVFYYWAFSSGRFLSVLELMAGSPNLDYSNNQVAAVMFVFGSMMFLYAGFFASPDLIRQKLLRLLMLLSILISAITSGRSALLLSVLIGGIVFFLAPSGTLRRGTAATILNILFILIAAFLSGYALASTFGIDASIAFNVLFDKISSGGGAGRKDYLPLLIQGAADRFFLGAGHGIGVSYQVSEKFPWRYEVVGAATLFRVGIIGTIIYLLPFIIALRNAYRTMRTRRLSVSEKYLLGGFLAVLVSANTNPYIEAFAFQWMFILPSVYFIDRKFLYKK